MGIGFIISGIVGSAVSFIVMAMRYSDSLHNASRYRDVAVQFPWISLFVGIGFVVMLTIGIIVFLRNWFYEQAAGIDESRSDIGVMKERQANLRDRLHKLLDKYVKHEEKLISAVQGRDAKELIALFEHYPVLKASANVKKLTDSLIALETDISDKKLFCNERVQVYNTTAKQIPARWLRPTDLDEQMKYESTEEK